MMNVTISNAENDRKYLRIKLEWDEIKEEYNDLFERYRKVSMKGVRQGKAPAGLVESAFKTEIKEDLVSICSSRFCRIALKENDLGAASPLEITDIEMEKDNWFAFTASFIEAPVFELPDYKHLNLKAVSEEKKIDEISLRLLEKTTLFIHPELVDSELIYSEEGENSEEKRKSAEERVKLMLILKKIALKDNIEIDDKDVNDRIAEIARENEVTPEQLRKYLIVNDGLPRFSDSLLAEQVLQYIRDIQE